MKQKELEWELRIFNLLSIVIIGFCILSLRVSLGVGGVEAIFLQAEMPNMILSLVSSVIILTIELIVWYIFRVDEKDIKKFIIKK